MSDPQGEGGAAVPFLVIRRQIETRGFTRNDRDRPWADELVGPLDVAAEQDANLPRLAAGGTGADERAAAGVDGAGEDLLLGRESGDGVVERFLHFRKSLNFCLKLFAESPLQDFLPFLGELRDLASSRRFDAVVIAVHQILAAPADGGFDGIERSDWLAGSGVFTARGKDHQLGQGEDEVVLPRGKFGGRDADVSSG